MAGTGPGRGATAEPPTLELVLKRNSVERLKREKSPLGMLDELPALIAAGYADVPEEDIVRLKWWGLYHDKPKVGTFMLRIKLAAGRLSPAQLRAIGQLSIDHGKGEAELTTRQNVQLHYLRLAELPAVFEKLHAAGSDEPRRLRRRGPGDHRLPRRRDRARRALRRRPRWSRRRTRSSPGTPTTSTCRVSTRSRSAPAPTAASRPRSTASRSSACCATASLASACSSAAGCRRCRVSRATSASSSARTRRSPCCARCSTPGATISATASPASSRA